LQFCGFAEVNLDLSLIVFEGAANGDAMAATKKQKTGEGKLFRTPVF
jgi:hypothetical protein